MATAEMILAETICVQKMFKTNSNILVKMFKTIPKILVQMVTAEMIHAEKIRVKKIINPISNTLAKAKLLERTLEAISSRDSTKI